MEKLFNTAGPCRAKEHYMIPAHTRIDGLELMNQKIVQVVLVRFGEEERTVILLRSLEDDVGDREELEEPESMPEHGPIEKRAGGPAVAVDEGVVVGEPEVKKHGADDRMKESGHVTVVGELA